MSGLLEYNFPSRYQVPGRLWPLISNGCGTARSAGAASAGSHKARVQYRACSDHAHLDCARRHRSLSCTAGAPVASITPQVGRPQARSARYARARTGARFAPSSFGPLTASLRWPHYRTHADNTRDNAYGHGARGFRDRGAAGRAPGRAVGDAQCDRADRARRAGEPTAYRHRIQRAPPACGSRPVGGSAHVVRGTKDVIERSPAGAVAVYLTLRGDAWFQCAAGAHSLRPGDVLACDTDRPFTCGFRRGIEELVDKADRAAIPRPRGCGRQSSPPSTTTVSMASTPGPWHRITGCAT